MRYFLDTEFIEDGKTIDLISIGIVCEDGRELYLQSCEFDHRIASEWVRDNVLSHLQMCPKANVSPEGIQGLYRTDRAYHKKYGGQCPLHAREPENRCPWGTRGQIRDTVRYFFNPSDKIELWGWCSGYDFVAFCQLFGTMMDVPKGYPHYIKDLQHVFDERGISDDDLPQQETQAHNALEDAKHIKKLWEYTVWN